MLRNKKKEDLNIELVEQLNYLESDGYWKIDNRLMDLIRKGADPMTKSKDGNTLVTIAAQMAMYCDRELKDYKGPLYMNIVTELVEKFGVSMNTPNNKDLTPLRYLLDRCDGPLRKFTPGTGLKFVKNWLHDHKSAAAEQYMFDLAFQFIKLGANPETTDKHGQTLRSRLSEAGDLSAVHHLDNIIKKQHKSVTSHSIFTKNHAAESSKPSVDSIEQCQSKIAIKHH